MASLQFRTYEEAIDAFDQLEVPVWALYDGKRLQFKGEGSEELRRWLEMLHKSLSQATYTLCYYEDLTSAKQVKSSTPFDGSFNFKLDSNGAETTNRIYHERNDLLAKVAGLENTLAAISDRLDGEEDTEKPNRLGIVGDIIGHPAIAPLIPTLITAFMGMVTKQSQPQQQLQYGAAVGNVPNQPPPPPPQMNPRQFETQNIRPDDILNDAVQRLQLADGNLPVHLAKLADIAERDPATFNMIMATLDGYQLPAK